MSVSTISPCRPLVMGILNVTPDSFSDGGHWCHAAALEQRVAQLLDDGADIIDVGGESTRPQSQPVSVEEELARVLPAIRAIRLQSELPISIDTTKAVVAKAALDAGATMVNDISALRFDPDMAEVVRSYGGPVIIMHMQGTPLDMQDNPCYDDLLANVLAFFQERIAWLGRQGIDRSRIIIDPGIGFGKTLTHNLQLLRQIKTLQQLACPVLIGHSRKSFLGQLLDLAVAERDLATAVASFWCAQQGCAILRVHDVLGTVQACRLAQALSGPGSG